MPITPGVTKVRLFGTTGHTITAADTGAETLTIAGDYTTRFVAGEQFIVYGGNNSGAWTVDSSSYGGVNTVITVTGNITSAVAGGKIIDFFDFERWATWVPHFPPEGPYQYIPDRLGVVHRVGPTDATEAARYPMTGTLTIDSTDFDITSNAGLRLAEFLYTECIEVDNDLVLFCWHQGKDVDATNFETKDCYKVKLMTVPDYLYGSRNGVNGNMPESLSIELHISADGASDGSSTTGFTSFDDPTEGASKAVYRSRPT